MRSILLALVCLTLTLASAHARGLRVATYNAKYLSACVIQQRAQALGQVVAALDADVAALQEIRDRRALERFFPADRWDIIIDDASTDDQNLAYAIRKHGEYALLSGPGISAQPTDFLFPSNSLFPIGATSLR